jgi:NAD(P) transhydrogenase subunit alpha
MKIAIPKESGAGEKRVALTPESVKRLVGKKFTVAVQKGAGQGALFSDADYEAAGAAVAATEEALLSGADLVVQIGVPTREWIARLPEGAALISLLFPLVNRDRVQALVSRRISAIAMDMLPRTTVAQMMDVLSSQATIAGYEAVLLAAVHLPRLFPKLTTAAGTVAPARAVVVGAGVAGLTAIGTARRLGAVVEAFDVRKAVKEQVESLGAKFIEVAGEDAETKGGYAKEVSEDYKRRQAEALKARLREADVCITTALIPGQRAPVIIPEDMVQGMKPGAVIVDLAAEQGGNCALTEPGKVVTKHGVTIIGELNLPGHKAVNASQMYGRNMEKLIQHLCPKGELLFNLEDEIIRGCLITQRGEVVNERVREALSKAQS